MRNKVDILFSMEMQILTIQDRYLGATLCWG
jgi:hypothetical protein